MRKHYIEIEKLKTTKPKMFVTTEVGYNIGGPNYFTGGTMERGYYLHVTPQEIGDGVVKTTAFSGTQVFLAPTTRFSRKMLEHWAKNIKKHERYQEMVAHVLKKNGLALEEGDGKEKASDHRGVRAGAELHRDAGRDAKETHSAG